MRYELRRADPMVKWLVTCLLATFGVSYVFGAWMVRLYAGFTPNSVAATYAEPEMHMRMPPDTTVVVQRPVTLAELTEGEHHTVDRDLLIQDTHVHLPMYGVIAGALSLVVVGLALPRWTGFGLISLLFAAPWLDFAGMWLTKLVARGFAVVTLAGGWAMGLGYTIVTAIALWQMWRPTRGVTV
ncbi:MAG: hypothetical protein ACREMM_07550 [Gemmatimonadales bacterium]